MLKLKGLFIEFFIEFENVFIFSNFNCASFRGAFGEVLKLLACMEPQRPSCAKCPQKICGYRLIFEGIPDTERFARYKTPPKPYTIYFHSTPLKTGITLTLWGKAAQFRDLAVLAVSAIGTRGVGVERKAGYGRFSIKNIEEKSLDFSGFNKNYPIPYTPEFTLNLKTPLRIKRQGKVLTSFDIKEFMKTLLERQSLLSYYYDENPEILDYRNLLKELESVSIISAATEFKYIERYSRRQKRFVNMAGIIGSVRVRDFPISLWDHICFGIYTGCGEHTTAGLGKYEILAEK